VGRTAVGKDAAAHHASSGLPDSPDVKRGNQVGVGLFGG
jgi:hypothetical protein